MEVWFLAASALVAAVLLAGMAAQVWRARGRIAGLALAVVLLAVAWWGACYAGELVLGDTALRTALGALKYVGVCLLPPSLLVFTLDYTGRERWVRRSLLVALSGEPLLVWAALAVPGTRHLVRYYESTPQGHPPVVGSGPLFWVNLAYCNVLLVVATVLFLVSMVRLARSYRLRALVLVGAALLPWVANGLFNFGVGVFARLDLTPFAFLVTGGALVYGLFLPRMTSLSAVAWNQVVHTMADGILLVDPFGRVVDANPSAGRLLGCPPLGLHGRSVEELLPRRRDGGPARGDTWQVALGTGEVPRFLDVERQVLTDRSGAVEGELVLVHDATERIEHQHRMEELLAERTRIAATLTSSLLPARLPSIDAVALASRYLPARGGSGVGGDFFDVFVLEQGRFGFVLGDVSGKGAEAAAVTGLVRYTLRALATPSARPSVVLARVNEALLRATDEERYCTLVYGVAERRGERLRLRICLAGHHPPVLRPCRGAATPVGELGSPLGLLPGPELVDTDLVLAPGDLLCLFTDGLVDVRAGEEWFGTERVLQVLGALPDGDPERALAALLLAAEAFEAGPRADDLTMLALQNRPACPEAARSAVAAEDAPGEHDQPGEHTGELDHQESVGKDPAASVGGV